MGLALAAGAHADEPFFAVRADRQDVVRPDKDVDFADDELSVLRLDGLDDREQGIAVFLDLGPRMALPRVLDSELVQAELVAHLVQLGRVWVLERDPHEAVRPLDVLADVLLRDVGELAAFLVSGAIDEHDLWLRLPRGAII